MNLQEVRAKIDAIDDQIAGLYAERMNLAVDIAQNKIKEGLPVDNVEREKEIINRVTVGLPDNLKLYCKQVFETMFETSKAYQYGVVDASSPIKDEIKLAIADGLKPFPVQASVACQGVKGAYSCIAAEKIFPISSISCFKNWDGVFSAVEKGFCEFGVLPVENSTVGSVIDVYDLMRKHRFFIVKSIKLRIKHYLLAAPGVKMEDIREIVSHNQAISQCSEFLAGLGDIKITGCDNTAVAAKIVAESGRKDIACISSRECAELYGLQTLKSEISNSDNNYTRFIAISNKLRIYDGSNRISITLNLAHEAGSLNKLLNKFCALGLNLTKLESRPIPNSPFEFTFYFDFEADVRNVAVQNLLANIALKAENFNFLGAYEEM
ncbi:MAG: chorismate mutase [Bacteroides sp.]|nr:chorismate mutase [Bacillota bacterium]MCM1393670.1 chorismate mutase [[Eubacterium] siraeum]MCM1455231.1 chorismate mutase [Bacteroides sp.]